MGATSRGNDRNQVPREPELEIRDAVRQYRRGQPLFILFGMFRMSALAPH